MADLKTTNIYGDAYINNKVGINTNTPATRLQIGQLSPTAATEGIQFGDDTGTRIYRGASGTISISGNLIAPGTITFPNTSNAGLTTTDGTALFRLDDIYGNIYLLNNAGGFYVDATSHNFRNASSTALMTISSVGDVNITRYISGTYINTSDDVSTSNITYIMAKFGDNYHRSATAAKVASFISGQTMNISGTATNITAYTINQNVGTGNTPSFAGIVSSAVTNYAFLQVTDSNNFWITPGNANWGLYFETTAGGLLGGTGDSNRLGFVGSGTARFYVDLNNGNGWFGNNLTVNNNATVTNDLTVNGNTYLGNANNDTVYVNDTIRIGATDSGDASLFFGEGAVAGSDYGARWYWDSGYTFTWYTRNAGTDTALFDYVTNDLNYINWRRNFHMQNKEINYNAQVHFNAGTRFVGSSTQYLIFRSDSGTAGGIQVQDGSATTKGYTGYWDAAGGGILNNTGNWALRYNFGSSNSGGTLYGDWGINGNMSVTGATMTNLTGAYQNTTVYDSPRTQSATPSRGIRAPASSIQFTDSYAIAPFYTYRSTGDWPVPYGIGWGTGGESSGIFQRYASNGYSFGDMIFYTGNDGYGAFSFRRHTWEGTTYFAAGSGELNTELFRIDWSGNLTMLGTLNGSANSATLYANNGSYGAWAINGTRNGWGGIEFANNGVSLMMGSDTVGFHQNTNGWLFRVHNGSGFIYKGSWGGGTAATIFDSSNYTTLANGILLRAAGVPAAYGDWNTFGNATQTTNGIVQEFFNLGSGTGNSNFPPVSAYYYGILLNFGSAADARAQVYISHAGNDLIFRGGWGTASWNTWNRVLTNINQPYAYAMNQYTRTTDTCSFAAVTATTFTGALSGNATTATTLQTARAINGVSFNGSADITVNGLNYNVNNVWLRENGDDAQFQMYGNTRTMIYRTDGNTNPHGGGAFAHIFYYGGSADANRMFIINTDGRLWSTYHGWLDTMSTTGNAGNVSISNLNTQQVSISLAAGSWYTIAANDSNRASAKFTITDTTSGLHQAIHFYATAHYGNLSGAKITVVSNTYYGGPPVSAIRIMTGGTYDGAMVQIYALSACNLTVSVYDNQQSSGWVIKSGVVSTTNPGTVSAFANLTTVAASADLTAAKSFTVSDDIFIGGATTQYKALHAGNYNSYAPSLTGANASGTWSVNITGNAATATSADNIDGRTFVNTNSNLSTNADTINSNGISYYAGGVTNFSGNATDGALYSQAYSNDWQHQIAGDYRSGQIALRGKNNGTWQSWRRVLDETNAPYALNMNQYVRTTDSPTFADLFTTGQYQIRNSSPTITLRDTDHRTGYIHVNSNIFYVLTGPADSASGGWSIVANSRWPLEINLSNNNATFGGDVNAISFTGPLTGNATTATTLQTARNINGTSFNGSAAITTATWGTARTLTVGSTGKSVDGSASVTWSLAEIGAVPLAGGTMTGVLTTYTPAAVSNITGSSAFNAGVVVGERLVTAGVASFVPAFGQTTVITSQGYRSHMVLGSYRNSNSNWAGGPYIGWGGNDNYPTEFWLFNQGGSITHSGGKTFAYTDGTNSSGNWGINVTGNAGTATTLQTARNINGTSFDGSSGITTATWGTARTITIGNTGKSVDGSAAVSWSLAEIGASGTTVNSGNTSAGWYPIVWHSGNTLYSTANVLLWAANGYIQASYFNSSDNDESGITRFVIKNGDGYHRSATTTTAADVIRGVASGNWSINVTGTAGSISGYNNPATGASASTIAYRDANADLTTRYFLANRTSAAAGQCGIQLQTGGSSKWWMYLRTNDDNVLAFYTSNATADDIVRMSSTGLGIKVDPSNRLHINGDNSNPAIRVDNGAVVLAASAASNSKTFYGWLPISIAGTTKWIQMYN